MAVQTDYGYKNIDFYWYKSFYIQIGLRLSRLTQTISPAGQYG